MQARSVDLKDRKTAKFSNFLGVDFSNSVLQANVRRAIRSKNLINRNGVNEKRYGWEQKFRILDDNEQALRINGLFFYPDGDLIVHAGTNFYLIRNNSVSKITSTLVDIDDCRSQFYMNNGFLYNIGAGEFVVIKKTENSYTASRVYGDSDTYIPTTTISISQTGSTTDTRTSFEQVNLLTKKRKNTLLGVKSEDHSMPTGAGWQLDSTINGYAGIEVYVESMVNDNGTVETYKLIDPDFGSGGDFLYIVEKNGTALEEPYTEGGNYNGLTGLIGLSIDTTPPVEGQDNITVVFDTPNIELADSENQDYYKHISTCKSSVLFGTNGNMNRLFVGCSDAGKNLEYYSEEEDFTYFPYENVTAVGTDASAIMGFANLSDDTLAIYKDGKAKDSAIYYQTGTYQEHYTDDGVLINITTYFPISAGGTGEGTVSRYASASLAGDNLTLYETGVQGIVLAGSAATTERYTRERSRNINSKLMGHNDLSESVAFVFDNKYLLCIDDVCYVADARYKFNADGDIDGSYNYEWWYWENIPARCFVSWNGRLWFGAADGSICQFIPNTFSDRYFKDFSDGEFTTTENSSELIVSSAVIPDMQMYETIVIKKSDGNPIYSYLAFAKAENINDKRKAVYQAEYDSVMMVGKTVYFSEASGLTEGVPYTVYYIDRGTREFSVCDSEGIVQEFSVSDDGSYFAVMERIDGASLTILEINREESYIKVGHNEWSVPCIFSTYNNSSLSNLHVTAYMHKPVCSEWYTPAIDLGSNMYAKCMERMTVCASPDSYGKLEFGYNTRKSMKSVSSYSNEGFDFNNIDFTDFSFETEFASSYTVKCHERNFNYIMFKFVCNDDKNCSLNDFSIIYKVNKLNRGVN